jgi:hypothetical protein
MCVIMVLSMKCAPIGGKQAALTFKARRALYACENGPTAVQDFAGSEDVPQQRFSAYCSVDVKG